MKVDGGCEVISGVERLWNGGAVMLGFWVRLGKELGVICWELEAGFRWRGRRRKVADFLQGRGGELGSLGALDCSLSQNDKRLEEGGEWPRFYQGLR